MAEAVDKLWDAYKETGDGGARDELLLHYTYLVKWIVRRMMPKYSSHTEYDDLVSCGVLGLIDAMDKFNPDHGVKFETYAVARIRGEILDYLRAQDWAPPSLRRKINLINRACQELEGQGDEQPSEYSVATATDMPVEQVQKIMSRAHMFNIISFEEALSSPQSSEEPKEPEESSPENLLLEKEQRKLLAQAIDALSERERLVVTLYYYEGLMLKEIAEIMSVTESRVSQIHSRTIAKMRDKLRGEG
jgi:RNA polymerase sigma factor for flagellar operon FliA